jgi:hypothetical protein
MEGGGCRAGILGKKGDLRDSKMATRGKKQKACFLK